MGATAKSEDSHADGHNEAMSPRSCRANLTQNKITTARHSVATFSCTIYADSTVPQQAIWRSIPSSRDLTGWSGCRRVKPPKPPLRPPPGRRTAVTRPGRVMGLRDCLGSAGHLILPLRRRLLLSSRHSDNKTHPSQAFLPRLLSLSLPSVKTAHLGLFLTTPSIRAPPIGSD